MSSLSRRNLLVSGSAMMAVSACGNGIGSNGSQVIDSRVNATVSQMHSQFPGTIKLTEQASGMLVMPLITKAGFGLGGSFGRGALRIAGTNVDYYSAASGSFGLQIGAQQFAHVLFFMTDDALSNFRRSSGWAAGGDVEYAVRDEGGNLAVDTTTALDPVIAVIFGQAGLAIGATLEGTKYTRIIP